MLHRISTLEMRFLNILSSCYQRQELLEKRKRVVLLIGPDESGKSTLIKQLKLRKDPPLSDEDAIKYGVLIRAYIVDTTRRLCEHIKNNLDLSHDLNTEYVEPFEHADLEDPTFLCPRESYKSIMNGICSHNMDYWENSEMKVNETYYSSELDMNLNHDSYLFEKHIESIRSLWQSDTVRKMLRDKETQFLNHSDYELFSELSRISSPIYRPTRRDILLARFRLPNAQRYQYVTELGSEIEFVNTGRQPQEYIELNQKEPINSIVFIVSLADFDAYVDRDGMQINKVANAIEIFQTLCHSRNIKKKDANIFLLLNKIDILDKKLKKANLQDHQPFEDFTGKSNDCVSVVKYFLKKFIDCAGPFRKKVISHATVAIDFKNMDAALDMMNSVIRNKEERVTSGRQKSMSLSRKSRCTLDIFVKSNKYLHG